MQRSASLLFNSTARGLLSGLSLRHSTAIGKRGCFSPIISNVVFRLAISIRPEYGVDTIMAVILLTHAMEARYCGCIIKGGLLINTCYGGALLWLFYRGWPVLTHAMKATVAVL